jgi:hypothetical protein
MASVLRCAVMALAVSLPSVAASCADRFAAVPPLRIDLARLAGDWYPQALWGTGARSMLCAKLSYTATPSPGVSLGVSNTFFTPYMNALTLTGTKSAPNTSHPARFLVSPTHTGPLRLHPTPSWIVALADDYSWAAEGA